MQYYLISILSALGLIVAYFLRLLHVDIRQDIAKLKEEVVKLSTKQSSLETKQTEIEKSIEREIKHIRELIDTKLDSITEVLEKLLIKDEKK